MKQKITAITLLILNALLGFLCWFCAEQMIRGSINVGWLMSAAAFSVYVSIVMLTIVAVKEKVIRYSCYAFGIASSLIFVSHIIQIAVIILSFLAFLIAEMKIMKEISYSRKILVRRSLRFGKIYIIAALSMLISSQYYLSVKDKKMEDIIPKFDLSFITTRITPYVLRISSPYPSDVKMENMTIDEFILSQQSSDFVIFNNGEVSRPEKKEYESSEELKKAILEANREKFAEMVGREVSGSEKITNFFSETVNKQINFYFTQNSYYLDSLPIMPFLAFLLFLTIFSIGSFLSSAIIWLSALFFKILVKMGSLSIKKTMAEVETLSFD